MKGPHGEDSSSFCLHVLAMLWDSVMSGDSPSCATKMAEVRSNPTDNTFFSSLV